ncbi:MAG: hypothetical protein JSU86_08515 [Phycisphaerales bacterium]|nr:MAG: hypothetical protein JSU86_08515 [Phycisphaerales bacterium]
MKAKLNGWTKVIIALVGILATASLCWGGWVKGKLNKVDTHETEIAVLKEAVENIGKDVRWMRDNWSCQKE